MSNVDRVGPTPPPGSTSKGSAASPKNFQETMKQVEKVQEIDPDEASRRQRASDVDTLAAKKKGEEVAAAAIVPAKPARSPVVNSKEFQKTLQKVEKLEKTDADEETRRQRASDVDTLAAKKKSEEAVTAMPLAPEPAPFSLPVSAESKETSEIPSKPKQAPRRPRAPAERRPISEKNRKKAFQSVEKQGERGTRSKQQKRDDQEIANVPGTPFLEAHSFAAQATTRLAPYLSKELIALFQKMVGTMMGMVSSSGILHLEVVLDQPGFEHSVFYGATLIIDRYASAANAMNIVLTGSNAAVELFRSNIPNLAETFKKGRFSFKVDRMEAHYRDGIQPTEDFGETTE